MTKHDAYKWYNETSRADWDNWSIEAAQREIDNWPDDTDAPDCTAEELYEIMAEIVAEDDALNHA